MNALEALKTVVLLAKCATKASAPAWRGKVPEVRISGYDLSAEARNLIAVSTDTSK